MTTIFGSRRDADGNTTAFVDTTTYETILRLQPCVLDEDFIGAGHNSIPLFGSPATAYPWVQKTIKTSGLPSVAIITNSPGGIAQMALDATSEAQEATLYANDVLNYSMALGLVYESRVALAVLPGALVESVWGVQSAWASGPDNAAYYARFQVLASGLVNMQTRDGVNTLAAPTGITLTAGVFSIFRIDASDPTDVQFWINGSRISTAGQFSFKATGAAAQLQPYCSVYKASGTGTGSLQVDMIQIGVNRL